jgi:hypothetical protein
MVIKLIAETNGREIYDLAAWMREFASNLRPPEALLDLDENAYRRLWRGSLPAFATFTSSLDVAAYLLDFARRYDHESLLAEIASRPGARATISSGNIAHLNKVPRLEVSMPLTEATVAECLELFVTFLEWPRPKSAAWASFRNVNPPTGPDDCQSIRCFYRDDEHKLVLAVERASGDFRPDIERWGVAREQIGRLGSVKE